MPGPLYHVGATAMCPHAGPITTVSSNVRVLVSGMPVATLTDTSLVAGCPFVTPAGVPHPCVRVQWLTPAVRVLVNGQPPLTQASTGLCLAADQAPQGPPVIVATQPRVVAT
ncbi:MAG TPA: hypothetical protein VKA30_11795 [Actinomycetota bacterium]|nr:hypothetical protein [Actinomycetota bacterium]